MNEKRDIERGIRGPTPRPKAVLMTEEEYAAFRPIIEKFEMEVRDIQSERPTLMKEATLVAEKKMNKERPWLVDLTISPSIDRWKKTFTYNDMYMTMPYEVVADYMYRAYTELLSDIKRLK